MHKYEEERCIGRGSYGSAHLVTERATSQRYVIKKIPMELLTDQEKLQSFREVELLSKLKHPNVVEYKENFVDGNVIHIVMAYCDGGDLAGRIKERAAEMASGGQAYFDTSQILDWFVQMTMAIKYLHEQRILHRDLKTSNIFLTTENVIKLGDFGIAKTLDSTLDQARTVVGTPYYMSPEVCESKPYSYASDVWSLGCVLFEMVALKHAFDAPNILTLILKIVQNEFAAVPPHYDAEISEILKKLLDKRPEHRPTMDQIFLMPYIRNHMQGLVASGGSLKVTAVARRPHGTPKRRGHTKGGRRSSTETGPKRRAQPQAVWVPITPQDTEAQATRHPDSLELVDISTNEESLLDVRLPERSTTPEPLSIGLEESGVPPSADAQLPSESSLLSALKLKAIAATAWTGQAKKEGVSKVEEDVEDDVDNRFQIEAEELMNPNFQRVYAEECNDSRQFYYAPLQKAKPRRDANTRHRIRHIGKLARIDGSVPFGNGKRLIDQHDDVIVERHPPAIRRVDIRAASEHGFDQGVAKSHREGRQKIDLTLSLDENSFDSELRDGGGTNLSESGILRELEMEADSSGEENEAEYTSNSEYDGEENFYSEHSGYSDDSDFIKDNEGEYSDDFEDSDGEVFEYANEEFVAEDADDQSSASGGAVSALSLVKRDGMKSPKLASSPAPRHTPKEVQWVMRNVAQNLMESYDNLSVA